MREIRKSTFREIKSSFGRFMAIFAIVALGVGFFAGLKVTKETMVSAMEEYLEEQAFYDYRLLSTLGFEQEDVEFLGAQDAQAVEGAVSLDVLYELEDGSRGAIKTHSITEKVNTLKLMAGRMPQAPNEVVADSNLFDESAIGMTIYLSKDNDEDTLEQFAYDEYIIVGTVQSPLYIQFERGNTSLGSGRLSGFIYMPFEGYDVDYFTEIYVRFEQDFGLYSQEYEDFAEGKEAAWEELTRTAADRRYQDILDEANAELADAKAEFEEKKAEGEAELADAAKNLADAREKLAEGEQALADAGQELADGENTLQEKETELADARKTVAEKEAELADGEAELARGKEEWDSNNYQVEAAKAELSEQRAELDAQAVQLTQQKENLQALAAAGMIPEQQLQAGLAQIAAGEQTLAGYYGQIDEGEAALKAADKELEAAWQEILDAEAEITEGKQALSDARKELTEGEKALADAKAELADAKKTLAEKEAEFLDAKKELADGEREYRDALKEFDEKIADAELEIADAEEEINDLEEPDTYLLGRDTNVGYVCFESDADIVAGISDIFPVFFFLVAALVCITTMNRMVEEQRTQIGVLKALGYGNFVIMSKYMIYSGLAALMGCVSGFLLGTWGFPKIIWYVYAIMYQADSLNYVFNWNLAVISLVVSMLCSIGSTWLSCRTELRQVAATLMRPKTPKAGKRIFLEYIPFLWKRLSFLQKVSVRNIFRYKRRLFMMIVGISGCTSMLVAGFGIENSIADVAKMQFQEIQIYDVGVTFKESVDEKALEELETLADFGITEYACVMEKNMDLVTEGGIKSLYLVVGTAEQMPAFQTLRTEDGEPIAYPETGKAVISHKVAADYELEVGDTITLRDEDMNTVSVEISGIYENYMYHYVHMSEDTWRRLSGGEPEQKTAYMNLREGTDAHQLAAELMQLDSVSNVTVNADMMERINSMLESLNLIVVVVIICAAGLAFIVLYNLTNINITERIREIATVKVLGFYKKETASYVFRENILLTLMGMLWGLLLGKFLHYVIMSMIQVDMVAFDICIKPISYVYSGILTYLFAWFVNKFMAGKLERISMTESLKSVD